LQQSIARGKVLIYILSIQNSNTTVTVIYTVSRKGCHPTFVHNFAKVNQLSKFFHRQT